MPERGPTVGEVGLSLRELESLARALDRGLVKGPLGPAALAAASLSHTAERLGPLLGLEPSCARPAVAAVLSERRRKQPRKPELVWTGPEAVGAVARDTATVVRDLFAAAERSVLIAGYAFDHGADIFEPLYAAMGERKVEVSLFADIGRAAAGENVNAHVARWLSDFFVRIWRYPVRPTVYYDPRTAEPDAVASLHAKCIVVDERRSLITSANFTDRGQTRNVEVGVLLDDADFARGLAAQWFSAIAAGVFRAAV